MEHNWPIIQMNSTSSTNVQAQEIVAGDKLSKEMVINARTQLQGRGQAENTWESEPCANLTFSIVLQPLYLKADQQFLVSQSISLGISDFLKFNKITSWIKWPNDILVGRKKIAGILIENSIMGNSIQYSIVGIGLNVNQEDFDELNPVAISMKNITGVKYNLDFVLHELLNCIYTRIEELKQQHLDTLKTEYLSNLYQYKKWGHYSSGNKDFDGIITDVLPTGELLIADGQGETHTFLNKEIVFL
jgi:BirA family transcriptional regulator, biotin operon repressor / biotin---[acetyl-CoA-carboxylase] ligase